MRKKLLQRKSEGFTIIEVMIVLAIAGLIMLIIFLAVPALQRNSRNTQYKNDASAYAAAVNEWSQNHNGAMPSAAADLTTATSGVNALAKLSQLTAPTAVTTASQSINNPVATGTILYVYKQKCDPANVGTTIAGTDHTSAVVYSVETSGSGKSAQCIDV
jgi:prepilin-type N-terminal cleavage/methylation domain-containing protein